MNGNEDFYNPFDRMTFSNEFCFLCGEKLVNNTTEEHIFPKWMLSKFNLYDKSITLLNRTQIIYRKLTIPCCTKCNNEHLSYLEKQVKFGVEKGYQEFIKIDELYIFQWISKIFYGLLYKEMLLPLNRKKPENGGITTPELLKKFQMLHGFLQSVRIPFNFHGFKPWSIFIFHTHEYDDKDADFDYYDSLIALTFAVRMHGIGIIACLQDNGTQKKLFRNYFNKLRNTILHPIQFNELCAKIFYKASLLNRLPKYITQLPKKDGGNVDVLSPPLQSFSEKPIYDEWSQEVYARILLNFLKLPESQIDQIFEKPDKVMSYIKNKDDEYIVYDRDGNIINIYK